MNGNSNQKIINDVYKFTKSNNFDKDKDILIIQYTYTNRWWRPNVLPYNFLSFHSLNLKSPIYNEPSNKIFSKELYSFYETFLKFFWDYKSSLSNHLMEIDFLKSYLEYNKINYIHYAFSSGGNTDEWKNTSIEKLNGNEYDIKDFDKLNLLKIKNFNFAEEWAIHNNYIDNTNHIYPKYQNLLGKIIINELTNKFGNLNIQKNIL
jgi:hypothetical protein